MMHILISPVEIFFLCEIYGNIECITELTAELFSAIFVRTMHLIEINGFFS